MMASFRPWMDMRLNWFKQFLCDCHCTDAVIHFFPELPSSEFQPIQQNVTSHHPTVSCTWTLKQRRYADSGRFECPKCLKTYSYFQTLKRHVKLECGKEPQLQCPHCPKRTIHYANLKRHIMIMHSLRWFLSLMLECLWLFWYLEY